MSVRVHIELTVAKSTPEESYKALQIQAHVRNVLMAMGEQFSEVTASVKERAKDAEPKAD